MAASAVSNAVDTLVFRYNFNQQITDLIESVALEEAALAAIANAEGAKIQNNGGGVFNHQFYFSNLANPASLQPIGMLNDAINQEFGSFKSFQDQFKTAALSVF